ncbi:MAG: SusC/RagA family TonB-linked outer membrane protein [Adhaeribacter sp.]
MQKHLRNKLPVFYAIMRNIFYALFLVCLSSGLLLANKTAGQQLEKSIISVNTNGKTITQLLTEIEGKTTLRFVFNPDNVESKKKLPGLLFKNEKVQTILRQLSYECREEENYVIVKKSKPQAALPADMTIAGTVKDSTGATLIGVTVRVKDKPTIGTSTDVNGKYILEVPENSVLVYSYTGFRTLEVATGNRKVLDVVLQVADSKLEEVVIVGYGTQKKISLVGSQSAITVKELKLPVSNLTNSLGGRVSGLVSMQKSGELGFNDANIYIRGISTFTNSLSKPLTLVDGVPREIANIDPEDIESFSILKDASATAVYGVRGANGVILITTKSGKAGKARYNIRYSEGVTAFTKLPDLVDGATYMEMSNEAVTTRGGIPVYSQSDIDQTRSGSDPYLYPNVNWMDEVFNKTGRTRTANANISGGAANSVYYVGLGYYDELGLYKTDNLAQYNSSIYLKRYNVTSNLTLTPSKTTTIKVGVQGYLANVNLPATAVSSIFSDAFLLTPVQIPAYYPNGKVADIRAGSLSNPWASLTQTGYANQWRSQIYSNLKLTQELPFITKGLSLSGLFSFDAYNYTSNRYTKTPDTWLATGRDDNGQLLLDQTAIGTEFLGYAKSNNGSRTVYSEGSLNYNRDFNKHNVGGMLLFNQSDMINTYAGDLESSLPYRFRGLAGRFTYGYNFRYFAEVNFGYNGSENFFPDKQYGFFPSGGLGWVVSEENFFAPVKSVIPYLKLRASHGIVGNSLIDGRRFAYLSTVSAPTGYTYGKTMNLGFSGKEIGEYAVDVQWETSRKTNLGLDLSFLQDKLSIQTDLFQEYRSGIFLRRKSLPAYVGMINAPYGNVGIIENKGFDASVNYNATFGEASLQLMGNFTFNRNEVVEDDNPAWQYPWLERKGQKVGQRFGYIALGLFESDEEVANSPRQTGDVRRGDIKYKDINADGVINAYDQVPIGYGSLPEIVYGFGFTLGYKSLGLSTLFQGASNADFMLNGIGVAPFSEGMSRGNLFSNIHDRWTPENPSQDVFYPRLTPGTLNDNFISSTWWLKKADYLRLKTLQLSYNLPSSWLGKAKIKSANIYLQGVNVLTLSDFKLWDVELGDGQGGAYPNTRSYNAGFVFNF